MKIETFTGDVTGGVRERPVEMFPDISDPDQNCFACRFCSGIQQSDAFYTQPGRYHPSDLHALTIMNVHVLQHVPFEGIGSMEPCLLECGARITYTRFYEPWTLPGLDGIDLLIVMGGPMSVNDEESLPWLVAEKTFIREAIDRGIAVIGICLGAQLIASACGARVYPGKQREIGWFEIEAIPAAPNTFAFPDKAKVLHWHGETFDLPAGAVHLARSVACENQAFQIGGRVLGLQFHPEVTPASLELLVEHSCDDLNPGDFVQSEAEIMAARKEDFAGLATLTDRLLEYLMKG